MLFTANMSGVRCDLNPQTAWCTLRTHDAICHIVSSKINPLVYHPYSPLAREGGHAVVQHNGTAVVGCGRNTGAVSVRGLWVQDCLQSKRGFYIAKSTGGWWQRANACLASLGGSRLKQCLSFRHYESWIGAFPPKAPRAFPATHGCLHFHCSLSLR